MNTLASWWWMTPPGGPQLVNSTKRFLQRLATRTNGRFFDIDASSKLTRVFLRVREMIENEATLSVLDPVPDAEAGRLKIVSRNPDCSVLVFEDWGPVENDPPRAPIIETSDELPRRFVLPSRILLPVDVDRDDFTTVLADPACREVFQTASAPSRPGESRDGFVEIGKYGIRGCAEDVTLVYGQLFLPGGEMWGVFRGMHFNRWVGLKTRPFEMSIPMVAGLPTDPVSLMDTLSQTALGVADEPVETDHRFIPPDAHARPYHDLPCFADGANFLEMRSRLARALYARPDYRYWVLDRLRRDSESAMADLEELYRRRFPDTPEEVLKEVVRGTGEGREILELARAPAEIDLQRYLGAWLGDVSAHDLFVRWETELINRTLGWAESSNFEAVIERWAALRRVLFVPSYTRVLALLALGYDPARDRIGYWRVVLPRPSWLWYRIRGLPGDIDEVRVPLDLIPDQPFALWVVGQLRQSQPGLVATWRERGYRARSIDYELTGEASAQGPDQAFQAHRITVTLEDETATERGRLVASMITVIVEDEAKKGRRQRKREPALEEEKRVLQLERLQWIPDEGPSREITISGATLPVL